MKIISRKEAKLAGLKRYFTGKPCKNGHVTERSLNSGCLLCHAIYKKKAYRLLSKENVSHQHLKKMLKKLKMTELEYKSLLIKQHGRCAICKTNKIEDKRKKRLEIDHDHKTNKVRGLLCSKCNRGLGCFQDSEALLLTAVRYLRAN